MNVIFVVCSVNAYGVNRFSTAGQRLVLLGCQELVEERLTVRAEVPVMLLCYSRREYALTDGASPLTMGDVVLGVIADRIRSAATTSILGRVKKLTLHGLIWAHPEVCRNSSQRRPIEGRW